MDIYEVLNEIITEPHYHSMSRLFANVDNSTIEDNDRILFELLKNISSMGTHVTKNEITFNPMFIYKDGSRSFAIEDITETDYRILEKAELDRLPLALRSLISDILWTQRKNYPASQIAAQSYWEAFQQVYKDRKYYEALNPLKRAVCISQQIKLQALYSEIYNWFCNDFIGQATMINVFCALRIMDLFFEQKSTDFSLIVNAVDSIISQGSNNDNILAIEQAYELEAKCYNKLNKKNEATKCNLALAQFQYDFAERLLENDAMGAFRSVDFYEKAIVLFRNNGASSKAESVHKKLVEVQKKIPKNMHTFRMTFDISKVIENIKTNMDGLSFEECIIRFTRYVGFESIDTLRKRTIKECTNNPLSSLFGTNVLDAQGKTIIKMAPLDDNDPEKDQELLEIHMFRSSLQTQRIVGDIWVKNILQYIRSRFSINNAMVDFLTKENCIIPEGRETIFQKGVGCFLRGEYYEAMLILAPQMESTTNGESF